MAGETTHTSRCLEHLRYLAETIGPRGSATAQEAEAAEYARRTLEELGLTAQVQEFPSATSAWRPYAMAVTLVLLALALYPLGGRVTAAVSAGLVVVVLVSAYLELNFA
ncbi:MAG TPA: hypothetical protein VFT91_11460, partial [Dehalococcoidia bacterium]|nr:hypothetical protein [Dehalococcoidia bacterium]